MTKRIASLTSMVLLVLGLATFAGAALAGNGNGKDTGVPAESAAVPVSQDATSGSSTKTPPGQAKKDQASTQAKGSADQNSAGINGIKPTNGTSKNTTCNTGGGTGTSATCTATSPNAAAASGAGQGDASKRYGNGTTAAQIANSRGAPANTHVYGPGNSQPHKVEKCPGSGKYVDVHAVKSYSSASCAGTSQLTKTKPTSPATTTAGVPSKAASASVAAGVQGTSQTAATPAAAAPTGGVLGVTESAGGGSEPAGGVLGAIEAVGQGTLPFTGFPLWVVIAIGLTLVVLGLALTRESRATV